jgi:hypothetical protein
VSTEPTKAEILAVLKAQHQALDLLLANTARTRFHADAERRLARRGGGSRHDSAARGENAVRKTVRPPRSGCTESPGWLGWHGWRYSHSWNGNSRQALPFWKGTRGIARSGWRCYHCGKFEWDLSDLEFAASFAVATNLVCLPKESEPESVAQPWRTELVAKIDRRVVTTEGAVATIVCLKCGAGTGADWGQCEGSCPMPMSPHYDRVQTW